ncbi:hypothetical protein [Amycolatopsis minnesotensis]|uniref:MFS transporter n=1 Tax=Amycolatopsis minnesotensis TaxID=337894 RepID=A0ABN2QCV7_9PSEU
MLAGGGVIAAAVIAVPAVGYAGFALAGIGAAASFPLALSLAGKQGKRADGSGGEREIAFVGTVGYTGFVAAPPVIGLIAQHSSLAVSFGLVGVVALVIAPLARGFGVARKERPIRQRVRETRSIL